MYRACPALEFQYRKEYERIRKHNFGYFTSKYPNVYEIMPKYAFVCFRVSEYAFVGEYLSKYSKIC